jgi:hypothetical protein
MPACKARRRISAKIATDIRVSRAFSVPIESERRLCFFVLTRFLDANRQPPASRAEQAPGSRPGQAFAGKRSDRMFRLVLAEIGH